MLTIHIGYHKTATTWLQSRVFKPAVDLDYWDVVSDPRHRPLRDLARVHDFGFDPSSFRSPLGGGPTLISWEGFVGDPLAGGTESARIAERLHTVFPDAQILVTIRDQRSLLRSLYVQYVHEGGALDLDSFLALRPEHRVYFSLDYLRYDRLLQHYQRLFGADRVQVLLYEQFVAEPERFLRSVGSFIGFDAVSSDRSKKRVNRSLSPWSLRIARAANLALRSHVNPAAPVRRLTAQHVRSMLQRHVDPFLSRLPNGTPARLPRDFEPAFAETNQWLHSALGLEIEKYGYALPSAS